MDVSISSSSHFTVRGILRACLAFQLYPLATYPCKPWRACVDERNAGSRIEGAFKLKSPFPIKQGLRPSKPPLPRIAVWDAVDQFAFGSHI